jgi:hypothetical protein
LYSACSIWSTVTSRRAARSRSIEIVACGFRICRSVETSVSDGRVRSFASSACAPAYSVVRSEPCSVYWYSAFDVRPPMLIGGVFCQ